MEEIYFDEKIIDLVVNQRRSTLTTEELSFEKLIFAKTILELECNVSTELGNAYLAVCTVKN